jgi:hypothetical protein
VRALSYGLAASVAIFLELCALNSLINALGILIAVLVCPY